MDVSKNSMIFFMVMVALFGVCFGTEYKVGDSNGWTNKGANYSDWVSDKTFYAGDTLLFEYNAEGHNVLRVTEKSYKDCNVTEPLSVTDSGADHIRLPMHGHYFYICGVPTHCEAGQKVDIRVLDGPRPSASPGPASTETPMAPSPTSHKGNAAPNGLPCMAGVMVALGVLAFFA